MLLKELIARLDKDDKHKQNIYVDDLQEILQYSFGISMSLNDNKTNTRVTCYWLLNYYTSECWIGYKIYFLDDRLLAMCYSGYEEDDCLTFANFAIKQELKEYILSFAKVEEEQDSNHYIRLDEDWKDGYKLDDANQLLATHVMYNGQKCKIIYPTYTSNGKEYTRLYPDKYSTPYSYGDARPKELINIELPDLSELSVDLNECDVCFNII